MIAHARTTPASPITRTAPLRRLLTAAAAACLLAAAGCSSSQSSRPAARAGMAGVNVHEDDVRFLEEAERSSTWALHMAELHASRGGSARIAKVAADIAQREREHLKRLAKERAALGLPKGPADHHANEHMREDERLLASAEPQQADWLYVEHMLQQRLDIISLANFVKGSLGDPRLREYASALPEERYRDVKQLRAVRFAGRAVPEGSRADLGLSEGRTVRNTGPTKATPGPKLTNPPPQRR